MRNSAFNPETSKRRVWFLEFYPDSSTYNTNDFLNTIKHFSEFAYILHDKDVNSDTGELKKPHYHAVVRTTPCLISSILNKFPGLPSQFVEFSHEFRWCIRYLIHLDDITKYQYDRQAIVHNLSDIDVYLRSKSELALVWQMVDLRLNGSSWYDLLKFSYENSCYDVYRRNFGMINAISGEQLSKDFLYKTGKAGEVDPSLSFLSWDDI